MSTVKKTTDTQEEPVLEMTFVWMIAFACSVLYIMIIFNLNPHLTRAFYMILGFFVGAVIPDMITAYRIGQKWRSKNFSSSQTPKVLSKTQVKGV